MQIFLTANPKLRFEVAKQFHKLRAAVLCNPKESRRLEELSNRDYKSLADVPSEAFPVFWTTAQYLRAVDATLLANTPTNGPFFPRYVLACIADCRQALHCRSVLEYPEIALLAACLHEAVVMYQSWRCPPGCAYSMIARHAVCSAMLYILMQRPALQLSAMLG